MQRRCYSLTGWGAIALAVAASANEWDAGWGEPQKYNACTLAPQRLRGWSRRCCLQQLVAATARASCSDNFQCICLCAAFALLQCALLESHCNKRNIVLDIVRKCGACTLDKLVGMVDMHCECLVPFLARTMINIPRFKLSESALPLQLHSHFLWGRRVQLTRMVEGSLESQAF